MNHKLVPAKSHQLQIDIDSHSALKQFYKSWRILCRNGWSVGWSYSMTPSPSGKKHHCHITVNMRSRRIIETRIALQIALGSDRTRELLSLMRAWAHRPMPILFFEKEKDD